MQWHSAADFFAMGGYAVYVWGSLGACAVAMTVEPWLLRRRHRQLVAALRRRGRGNAGGRLANASAPRQHRRQAA
ncbi:MAG: heme exporter protein CcmD [Caldimonas sp.]